jgi:hypothetical protein
MDAAILEESPSAPVNEVNVTSDADDEPNPSFPESAKERDTSEAAVRNDDELDAVRNKGL